jgi:hypothetical protein
MYQRPGGTWVKGGGFTQESNSAWASPSRPGWVTSGGGLTSGGPGGYTGSGFNVLANGRPYVRADAVMPPQRRPPLCYQGCTMQTQDPFARR